jgi:hypothetical protein
MGTNYDDNARTMPPADEELQELDGLSYFNQKGETIAFKDIVIRAIEKIRIEGSKEMVRGGQRVIFSKELNDYIPITIPDQRKLFSQSVIILYDLLIWYFDDEAKDKLKELNDNIDNAYNKFLEEYLIKEYWVPYRDLANRTKIIQVGDKSNVGSFLLQQYEDYIFKQYRQMFQELILLYKRKNDLSNKRVLNYYE